MKWQLALGAVLLALWVPVTDAQSERDSIQLQVGADQVVLRIVEATSGPDAQDLRQEIDEEYGNDDGRIQASEVQRYEAQSSVEFGDDKPECFEDFNLARLDGNTPVRLAELRQNVTGAANTAVTSESTLNQVSVFTLNYRPGPARVTARISLQDMMDIMRATMCQSGIEYEGGPFGPGWTSASWFGAWQLPSPTDGSAHADAQSASDETYLIHPLPGANIRPDTIQPSSARPLWDPRGHGSGGRDPHDPGYRVHGRGWQRRTDHIRGHGP